MWCRIAMVVACWCVGFMPTALAGVPYRGMVSRLPTDARAISMGATSVAASDGARSFYWNPAALAFSRQSEMHVDYRRFNSDFTLDRSSFAVHLRDSAGSVAALRLGLLNQVGVSANDVFSSLQGSAGRSEFHAVLGFAQRPREDIAWGLGVGALRSTLGDAGTLQGGTGQAGILWHHNSTQIGAALQNLSFALTDDRGTVPYQYRLSLGGVRSFAAQRARIAVQADRDRGMDPVLGLGGEFRDSSGIALRLGRRLGAGRNFTQTWSTGVGYGDSRFNFDYALLAVRQQQPQHLLTFSMSFGEPRVAHPEAIVAPQTLLLGAAIKRNEPTPSAKEDAAPRPRLRMPRPVEIAQLAPRPSTHVSPSPVPPSTVQRRPRRPLSRSEISEMPVHPMIDPTPPAIKEPLAVRRYVVRGGVHLDMDTAALEVAAFYRGKLRPQLERHDDLYVVVLQRCRTMSEAHVWQLRAERAGLTCSIDVE